MNTLLHRRRLMVVTIEMDMVLKEGSLVGIILSEAQNAEKIAKPLKGGTNCRSSHAGDVESLFFVTL
ncbi:MAG: hypothetical protein ACU83V_03235 [Gammaproteobacteria bacterium]